MISVSQIGPFWPNNGKRKEIVRGFEDRGSENPGFRGGSRSRYRDPGDPGDPRTRGESEGEGGGRERKEEREGPGDPEIRGARGPLGAAPGHLKFTLEVQIQPPNTLNPPWSLQIQPGDCKSTPGASKSTPGASKSNPGAVKSTPGASRMIFEMPQIGVALVLRWCCVGVALVLR